MNLDFGPLLANALDNIRTVLSDPTGDMALTGIVLGMLLLLIALFFAIGYLIYSFTNRNRLKLNVRVEVPVSQNPGDIVTRRLIVIVAVIAILIGLNFYTGRSNFCLNCHDNNKEAKALSVSAHKGVACLQCHQPAGVSGVVLQKIDYSRWLTIYAITNKTQSRRAYIDDGACLRCHSEVLRRTTSRYSISVRHKDFLDQGALCTDCHNAVAHPGLVKPERKPTMDLCLKCHNDRIAKADCSTCHTKDIGKGVPTSKREIMKVGIRVAPDVCYRCHGEKKCTQCHGIRMPHPPDWVSNAKHALPAFKNLQACWRCHDNPATPLQGTTGSSCTCHGDMVFHGPWDAWRKNHGPIARGQAPGRPARRPPRSSCRARCNSGSLPGCHASP